MIDLRHGDCLEVMPTLEAGSIDLTVTSPPYDNLRTYNDSLEWGEHVWKPVLENLYRLTKDGGVVVWIVGDATIKGSETGTSFKQALYAKECGFRLHDTMIWQKPGFSAVGALATRYAPVFEYMFVFSKGKLSAFNPIKDRKNKISGTTQSRIRLADGTLRMNKKRIRRERGQRFNIWRVAPVQSNSDHPAKFPESLARDHVISWSNEGDTVFDPFLGSGTTGKMALEQGRNFIGIEKDAEYFEIAKRRIESTDTNLFK